MIVVAVIVCGIAAVALAFDDKAEAVSRSVRRLLRRDGEVR